MLRIKLVLSIIIVSIEMLVLDRAVAQIPLVPYENVNVVNLSFQMENPWAGGLNSPQFSEIDLDNDGLKDLVAFERNFYGCVKTYLNQGIPGESRYIHAPEFQRFFPQLRNWMLLRDYNCDGREDLFTSVPGGVAVYRNDSDGGFIRFTPITSLLLTMGLDGMTPLYVAPPDIPSITDIDDDGDLDILSFNIIGSTLEYHKNMSVENHGNCDELEYELRNACWGYFSEDGNNNNVTLYDTCEVNVNDPEKNEKHAGSTVLAIDLTGNGVKDLLLGDITFNDVVWLINGGTTSGAYMTEQGTGFPDYSIPVSITVFPAIYHIDVDNDGADDLLVAPNNPNTSENFNNIWFYKNESKEGAPAFYLYQEDFLQDGMIDLGERSCPAFFDENADGLQDIVAGSFGYFESAGNYVSELMLLRNTGTAEEPEFEIIDPDYADLGKYGFEGIYPAFGDLDNDGDQDMVIGDEEGKLHLFTNEAGAGNPAQFVLTHPNFMDIDAGESAKPQIIDVNRDGLPDLLLGERSGTLNYYENTGTAAIPDFSPEPTIEGFGAIDVMPGSFTGFSAPFMAEDSLGNHILYVGSEQGYLYLFDSIDNNTAGTFNLVDSLYLNGVNVSVNGSDINNDGRLDFVYGEFAGGLGLLQYGKPPVSGLFSSAIFRNPIRIYPNPAVDLIYADLSEATHSGMVTFSIYNLFGQAVLSGELSVDTDNQPINIGSLPRGIYFFNAMTDNRSLVAKFIK